MLLAKEMVAKSLLAKSNSLSITGQVTGEYHDKDPQMVAYLEYVRILKEAFVVFELVHVPREQNARTDLLAKLASSGKGKRQRTVIQETLKTPRSTTDCTVEVQQVSVSEGEKRGHRSLTQEMLKAHRISAYDSLRRESLHVSLVDKSETRMTPYRRYLADGLLPLELAKAKVVKKNANRYTLVDGKLFRHGYTHPILSCASGEQCTRIMVELHEGICGSHIGGRALLSKAIRAGYYWPTMKEDCTKYVQRCKQCQRHADWHHAPPEELRSIHSPWPFHTWGSISWDHFP